MLVAGLVVVWWFGFVLLCLVVFCFGWVGFEFGICLGGVGFCYVFGVLSCWFGLVVWFCVLVGLGGLNGLLL